ncbi:uncharacterized protein LOC104584435 [Brachypodium distachyon]|uniref:Uncharacterized protein n=1 Tax=Brachypodium distachyon TaxID=15368 RepID=A0A0Q3HFT8_BRADI|nr:uncharacterized protein LOC104584435 [Brachypodium distachyon]KQJ87243.1 hypothetical protein BRADI_4g09982v3 [Brachypodium distachyon]PNT62957.1 hypothetical protein BRADI_4g09982v3 [Brachypodium distachyon]|eukprot:XP_010237398.1 uncharacterized protein LOC104584435 [Brachypodium distachyon]
MLQEDLHQPRRRRYILDSVAAAHATGSADLLTANPPPDPSSANFHRRDGKALPGTAVGIISTPRFALQGVLLVPDLGPESVIVSVRQLARRGLAVTFGGEACSVKERGTGVVVGEGRIQEEDGLYHLDFLRIPQIS